MRSNVRLAVIVAMALALGGCFEDPNDENLLPDQDPGTGGSNPPPAVVNHKPSITGTPPAFILEGEAYDFTPQASDADGDPLEFRISRKPAWASFNPATGRLWGTPGAGDVGSFTNIAISVTDGKATASLPNFDISVDQVALGKATLSWLPPTLNADGTPFTDHAGYKIYYGRDVNVMGRSVVLDNPGLTRYVVENLTPARWYFAMTTINSTGVESSRSAVVSKIVD